MNVMLKIGGLASLCLIPLGMFCFRNVSVVQPEAKLDPPVQASEVKMRAPSLGGASSQKSSNTEVYSQRTQLQQQLQSITDPNEMAEAVMNALREDEGLAHQVIATMDCAEVDCTTIVEPFLEFYVQEGRLIDGLDSFHVLKDNMDITLQAFKPLLVLAAEEDLDKAFEWCLANSDTGVLVEGFEEVGMLCVKSGNHKEYIQSVLDSEVDDFSQASFLSGVLGSWIEEDSFGALEYFADFPQSGALDMCLITSIDSITKVDPVAACQWAEYITDRDLLRVTLRSVLTQWEETDAEMYETWQWQNPEEHEKLLQLIKL